MSKGYQLYYWPTSFRGCFVSYLLAYCDQPFEVKDNIKQIQALMTQPPFQQNIPFIGPPLLIESETGIAINQMPAIVLYLAKKLDLSPEDDFAMAMCMKVVMDCNDVLMELCRYNGSQMWERKAWQNFRNTRLPKWLSIFEESLARNYIGNEKINFADISICALFSNMMRCLPQLEKDIKAHASNIYTLCKQIETKASLAKFIAEEELRYGTSYCEGEIEASIRNMLRMDD